MDNQQKLKTAREQNKKKNKEKQKLQQNIQLGLEGFNLVLLVVAWIFFLIYYSYFDNSKTYQQWIPAGFSIASFVLFTLLQLAQDKGSYPVRINGKNKKFQIHFMVIYLSYIKICFNSAFLVIVIMARHDEYSISTYTLILAISTLIGTAIYSIQARRYRYGPPFTYEVYEDEDINPIDKLIQEQYRERKSTKYYDEFINDPESSQDMNQNQDQNDQIEIFEIEKSNNTGAEINHITQKQEQQPDNFFNEQIDKSQKQQTIFKEQEQSKIAQQLTDPNYNQQEFGTFSKTESKVQQPQQIQFFNQEEEAANNYALSYLQDQNRRSQKQYSSQNNPNNLNLNSNNSNKLNNPLYATTINPQKESQDSSKKIVLPSRNKKL